ncbi:hypothetical protein CPB85DRAFT_1254404 [Mucidula mucida]|nr:hypothetical protein CPB85DRAFT_1254404 [Mucidula mucida]
MADSLRRESCMRERKRVSERSGYNAQSLLILVFVFTLSWLLRQASVVLELPRFSSIRSWSTMHLGNDDRDDAVADDDYEEDDCKEDENDLATEDCDEDEV